MVQFHQKEVVQGGRSATDMDLDLLLQGAEMVQFHQKEVVQGGRSATDMDLDLLLQDTNLWFFDDDDESKSQTNNCIELVSNEIDHAYLPPRVQLTFKLDGELDNTATLLWSDVVSRNIGMVRTMVKYLRRHKEIDGMAQNASSSFVIGVQGYQMELGANCDQRNQSMEDERKGGADERFDGVIDNEREEEDPDEKQIMRSKDPKDCCLYAERFNPATLYWLGINTRKEAGDSPTQDPIFTRELKLLKDDISIIKRELELMATKKQLEGGVARLKREVSEISSLESSKCDHCGDAHISLDDETYTLQMLLQFGVEPEVDQKFHPVPEFPSQARVSLRNPIERCVVGEVSVLKDEVELKLDLIATSSAASKCDHFGNAHDAYVSNASVMSEDTCMVLNAIDKASPVQTSSCRDYVGRVRSMGSISSKESKDHHLQRPYNFFSGPTPCIFSSSSGSDQCQIFFPFSGRAYTIDVDLRAYRIVGTGMFDQPLMILVERDDEQSVVLFDDSHWIQLPELIVVPVGHIMASFSGDIEGDYHILFIYIMHTFITSIVYDSSSGDWIHLTVWNAGIPLHPIGRTTTSAGLSWIDRQISCIFSFDSFWEGVAGAPRLVALEPGLIAGSDFICPIVRDGLLSRLIVIRDGILSIYRLGDQVVVDGIDRYIMDSIALEPTHIIVCSSQGSGFLTSPLTYVDSFGPSQIIYMSSVMSSDCVEMVGHEGPVDPQFIHACYHPDEDGLCHCQSAVFMSRERYFR